jgi:hypothetical protein
VKPEYLFLPVSRMAGILPALGTLTPNSADANLLFASLPGSILAANFIKTVLPKGFDFTGTLIPEDALMFPRDQPLIPIL